MQTIHITYPVKTEDAFPKQVIAIGDFDGVHAGHQEVIRRAIGTGRSRNLPVAVMTFHPHPREVLGQDKYVQLLTPPGEKEKMLEQLGVTTSYVVSFDSTFMQVSPESFVEHMLVPMGTETVVVGFDFHFGHKGSGTPDTLCELARGRFAVEVVRPFHMDGDKVSSTRIREHLLAGEVTEATHLLGRPYMLTGEVVHGDGRGRTIGFPTANVQAGCNYVIPARGVYAVRLEVGGRSYGGVMNIGVKPTFTDGESEATLEVHIFDFQDDIYGKQATIQFISYIRPERKFGSVDELIGQIKKDADTSRTILQQNP